MRAISLFFAVVAIGASAGLHYWLFRPFDPPEPVPIPVPTPDDPEEERDRSADEDQLGLVDVPPPPSTAGGAAEPPEEAEGRLATGEPREDLVVEFDAVDEDAVLAFADASGIPIVLIAPDANRMWPLSIGSGGVQVIDGDPPPARRFLPLPDRDRSGRRLRFEQWGLIARSRIGIDPWTATHLALALADSALDDAARAALCAHCAAQGVDVSSVREVVVRPVLAEDHAELVVTSITTLPD